MFKKIEIWILYLIILLSILFAISFGVLVRQELVGGIKLGWVSKGALTLSETPYKLKKFLEGGDLVVTDRFPNLEGFSGAPNTMESYLLNSRYDGDLQEGVIELIDLKSFKVLHTWNPDINAFNKIVDSNDKFYYLKRDDSDSRKRLMHPKLTSDGGMLFGWISPLRKIDACSNLIFQVTNDIYHHSIETDINGNIWGSTHIYPQRFSPEKVGRIHPVEKDGFNDNAIVKLSGTGEVIFEKSVAQILIDNGMENLIFGNGYQFNPDPIHLNDIQPVDFDGKFWKKGDVFLSMRNQSMILLYRPSTNKIIWKGVGPFTNQHDVDILDSHRISIFNNNAKRYYDGFNVDGNNGVIIYDFKTNKYSKYLQESLVDNDIKTKTEGRSQILPNGDLFIEETNYGRHLYINNDGSVKWTYINRAINNLVYTVGWSRILYTQEDIQTVNNFLANKGACNE